MHGYACRMLHPFADMKCPLSTPLLHHATSLGAVFRVVTAPCSVAPAACAAADKTVAAHVSGEKSNGAMERVCLGGIGRHALRMPMAINVGRSLRHAAVVNGIA